MYYAFIYPYLVYCNDVWGLACLAHLYILFLLQGLFELYTVCQKLEHCRPLFEKKTS